MRSQPGVDDALTPIGPDAYQVSWLALPRELVPGQRGEYAAEGSEPRSAETVHEDGPSRTRLDDPISTSDKGCLSPVAALDVRCPANHP